MKHCCEGKEHELAVLRQEQGRTLKIVLVINVLMFFVEFVSGIQAHSMALMGDSLDMLGDALVYGFSLFVLTKNTKWRAGAALLKAGIMLIFGLGVLGVAINKILNPTVPIAETMGLIGFIVLFANAICLFLLTRHRQDDLNMSSVWICSRNDIIGNIGVLIAALAVSYTHSIWPDILIGLFIALVFLQSSFRITVEAVRELKSV